MKLVEDQKEWDKLVFAQNGSYLQSWEWGELQRNLGREVFHVSVADLSALLIKYKLPFGLNYFYVPRGPSGSLKKLEILISEIQKLKERHKVIFLRVEPAVEENTEDKKILQVLGFKKSKQVQPETTAVLNLKIKESELYEKLDKDTRYAIKTAQKRGVKIIKIESTKEKLEKFNEFWEIFEATNKRHELRTYPEKYYREVFALTGNCRSKIFLGQVGDKTVSAALIIHFAESSTYGLASSLEGYGKFNAPSLLLWEAILDAKANGLNIFDLWGIDENNKKWSGITSFKKSFGSQTVKYIGTWDLALNKKWHFLFQLIKKFK
ncbi:MAG: FemAB family protein [Parcubacteria group bacterium Gr01-1014_20]|nr:MAG: FemAB family protein [Parcubacteria group bacterium Gr01-1014_20]